jgi:lipid-binding SYLF domain-containing protein
LKSLLKFIALTCALIALPAHADEFQDALAKFHTSPAAQPFFNNAYGYAIFPSVGKGGFFVGGAYGEGRVFQGGSHVGDVSLVQVSIGFQLGGQSFSELIFFRDKEAFDWFTGGSFSFDAQASAVVITAGAGAQAGSSGASAGATSPSSSAQAASYMNGVAVFAMQKGGLMYEASLGGQKFTYHGK